MEMPVIFIEEEVVQQETESWQSKEVENVDKGHVLKIKEYSYDTATEGQFKRKK